MSSILQLDRTVLLKLNGALVSGSTFAKLTEVTADWLIYALMAILLIAWFWPAPHRDRHRLLLIRVTLVALVAWQIIARALGTWINRPRPFEGVAGVQELLFHRPDYSFPSDHATFLATVAIGFFAGGNRQLGWLFTLGTLVVGFARVASGLHYPGDILAGIVLGGLVVLIFSPARGFIDTYLGRPLLNLARKLRLA